MFIRGYTCIEFGTFSHNMSRLMTKPTKWHVRPAKTQISLGIPPVWSESSLSAWRKLGCELSIKTAKTLIRLGECPGWSESSLGAQSFCWFCHEAAHIYIYLFCFFWYDNRLTMAWIIYSFMFLNAFYHTRTVQNNVTSKSHNAFQFSVQFP